MLSRGDTDQAFSTLEATGGDYPPAAAARSLIPRATRGGVSGFQARGLNAGRNTVCSTTWQLPAHITEFPCYIPILNPNYAFPYLYSHLCNPLFDTHMHSLIFDFEIHSITVTSLPHPCACDFSSCHQRSLVTASFVCMHLALF